MKYFIKTFGCQMNISDSERIAGFLESEGLTPASDMNEARLVVFNTCGVRQMAEDRVYGQIHNIRKQESVSSEQKRKIIILTGCLANRKDVQRKLKDKVDLFCEIKDFPKKFVGADLVSAQKRQRQALSLQKKYLCLTPKYTNSHTAYVPIMTGCNNFCSYCVVPYARGREVSRPAEDVIKEVTELIKKGCQEIILLGQNVNSYNDGKVNFSKILKKINSIPGNFWISFISNHPKDFSDELIETMAKCQKVCELAHLPIQAGNDEVLRNMNRRYTVGEYLTLIKKIRASFTKYKPDKLYAITSDIIVGFPGETRKQFLESAKIMKRVGYDMVYFGQYSPRPGTTAHKMKDNISKKEKVRREKYLNEILKKNAFANNKKYVGKNLDVLVTFRKDNFYFGHTRTMKNVKIHLTPASSLPRRGRKREVKNLVGKIIKAKITKANIWNLEGEII